MTSSYIGISAHFFSYRDNCSHCPMLAIRRIHHPTTGENIRIVLEQIINEWDIPRSKIMAVVTDNGSNIIKAFRDLVIEAEVSSEDAQEVSDEEDEKELEEDEKEGEEGDKDFEDNVARIDNEVANFDENEMDHAAHFPLLPRLSCFAHSLQLHGCFKSQHCQVYPNSPEQGI